jgi:hypothetical protein
MTVRIAAIGGTDFTNEAAASADLNDTFKMGFVVVNASSQYGTEKSQAITTGSWQDMGFSATFTPFSSTNWIRAIKAVYLRKISGGNDAKFRIKIVNVTTGAIFYFYNQFESGVSSGLSFGAAFNNAAYGAAVTEVAFGLHHMTNAVDALSDFKALINGASYTITFEAYVDVNDTVYLDDVTLTMYWEPIGAAVITGWS